MHNMRVSTICIIVSLIMTAVMMQPSFAALLIEAMNFLILLLLRYVARAEGAQVAELPVSNVVNLHAR